MSTMTRVLVRHKGLVRREADAAQLGRLRELQAIALAGACVSGTRASPGRRRRCHVPCCATPWRDPAQCAALRAGVERLLPMQRTPTVCLEPVVLARLCILGSTCSMGELSFRHASRALLTRGFPCSLRAAPIAGEALRMLFETVTLDVA